VAHQWWYGVVGNDQYVHAFLDEAMANASSVLYFRERYGEAAYAQQVDINLKLPYFAMLFTQGDQIVDYPTDAFPDMNTYAATVYGKGALGFDALRQTIGDAAFFAGLQRYYVAQRFTIATPDDMLAAFEAASGKDLTAFWHHWFEAPEGMRDYTRGDYLDLLRRLGQ
jgi:aminopeptidase N